MRHFMKRAQSGKAAIQTLDINPKSRDDIEYILRGLQYLYVHHWNELEQIFEAEFCAGENWDHDQLGMDCWSILVAGVLKQGIECNFDRLYSLVNYHGLVQTMMNHGNRFLREHYELQTLIDNVSLLTPALMGRVGQLLVASSHPMARKKAWRLVARPR